MRILTSLSLLLFVVGCATPEPAPVFTGPTAFISDSVIPEDSMRGQVFYVDAIDGKRVDSAAQETRRSSAGKGLSLSLWSKLRQVEVRPMRLTLVGSHITGAPIHELASRAAGTFFSVEGNVTFTPVAGKKYVVKGELKKSGSSVWLADEETQQPVTPIITNSK